MNVTPDSFDSSLHVMSGTHVGFIEGKAQVNGLQAVYNDSSTSCQLTFIQKGQSIQIENSDGCYEYAGSRGIF